MKLSKSKEKKKKIKERKIQQHNKPMFLTKGGLLLQNGSFCLNVPILSTNL